MDVASELVNLCMIWRFALVVSSTFIFSPPPLRGRPVIDSFIFGVILRALIAHASVDCSGNRGLRGKIAKGLNLCETQLSAEDRSLINKSK